MPDGRIEMCRKGERGDFGTGLLVGLKHQTLKEQKWGLVVGLTESLAGSRPWEQKPIRFRAEHWGLWSILATALRDLRAAFLQAPHQVK